jgi:hypothetical protein
VLTARALVIRGRRRISTRRRAQRADGDVALVEPHHEAPALESLEARPRILDARADRPRQLFGRRAAQPSDLLPRPAVAVVHRTDELRALLGLGDEGEAVPLEDSLDRVEVGVV